MIATIERGPLPAAGAPQDFLINLTNGVTMDIVFIGAIVLFAALIWGMTNGRARLGERK